MQTTQAETALGLQPGARGRKGRDGSEEVPRFDSIKEGCAEMMRAYKKLEHAREAFNDTVKSVAERGNVNAAGLKRLVRASATGNFKDEQRKIDQQSTLFEMIGEISDSGK